MIHRLRHTGVAVIFLLLTASASPAQESPGSPGDDAARIGARTVTMKEVEDKWRERNPAELTQATQAIYEGRRAALDAIVADMLIEQAAKAAGVTATQYTEQEVTKRIKPVTEADVLTFFQQNQSQMQDRNASEVAPAIRSYLEDQQRQLAQRALVAELRKVGPAVSVLFDAPRDQVGVAADDAALGPASAPVTLVEFSDFQCPFCQNVAPTLKRIKETYGDKVRIVWKDFPLTQIHPEAFKAAEAGNCAREQGKFWELHDRLFANQRALQPADLKVHATAVGLDAATFNACLDSAKYSARVEEHVASGTRLGVNATPTSFVNGRYVNGAQPYDEFARIIDEELQRVARPER